MCGYSTERIALDILSNDVGDKLQMKNLGNSLDLCFYLRETPDFLSALERVRLSLAQQRLVFLSEVPPIVLLYRGLEILLTQGFESPAYQQLLKKTLYRDAIVAACSAEVREKFESATDGLGIEHLGLLHEAESYFWGENSKQLRTLAQVLPSCRNILKHYVSWWLTGLELQKNDLSATMEEAGIMDPIDDINAEEHSRFDLLSRAFYFSILTVGSCSAGNKMLLAVAQRLPAGVPNFDGVDLWLQRIAALKLYEMEGFDSFCRHVSTIRATNYYYIDLLRGFSMEQKALLLEEVRRNPAADRTDNFIFMSKWLTKEA